MSALLTAARQLSEARASAFAAKPLPGVELSLGDALLLLGGLWVGSVLLSAALRALGAIFATATKRSLRSFGQWAVVTGASDVRRRGRGSCAAACPRRAASRRRAAPTARPRPPSPGTAQGIGKAYARALARAGLDVVLVARDAGKLAAVAAELREATGREVRVVVADFSQAAETGLYDRIKTAVDGLDVGVLVNNVGARGCAGAAPRRVGWAAQCGVLRGGVARSKAARPRAHSRAADGGPPAFKGRAPARPRP